MRIVALAALLLAAMPATAIAVVPADPWHASAADPVAMRTSAGHMPVKALVCRIFPGTSAEKVMAIRQRVAGPGAKVGLNTKYDTPRAGPVSPPNPEVFAVVAKAVHQHCPSVPIACTQPAGVSDGREFQLAGIRNYGTSGLFQRDEDEFAHGLNERVRVDAVYHSVEYMLTLITELAPLG